ncbi:MAG: hypothetical protein GF311_24990 [Candidatus Lokiarchaeota archaeon]|nr:hypothetical protein [Candidatus Lokiarchaeota archaeon]
MSSSIQRRFYSQDNELLCTLDYFNFSDVKITFNNPEMLQILEKSDSYRTIFLEEIEKNLASKNENLKIKLDFYEDTDFIEFIHLSNLQSIEEYNYITSRVMDLLSNIRESVITSKIERKFYSRKDKLLCIVNFLDFNRVNITFVNPDKFEIEKSSEVFRNNFDEKTISELKDNNPKIKVNYHHYEDSDIIESIDILNVDHISDYNFICERIMELLSEKAQM